MIKKVVIAKTEVKYVCELSEEVFKEACRENGFYTSPCAYFTKKETPKPLADDEISVEDCSESEIYAFYSVYSGKIGLLTVMPDDRYTFNYLSESSHATNVDSRDTFKEVILKAFRWKYQVYQFDTQQEFFEWALRQLGGK